MTGGGGGGGVWPIPPMEEGGGGGTGGAFCIMEGGGGPAQQHYTRLQPDTLCRHHKMNAHAVLYGKTSPLKVQLYSLNGVISDSSHLELTHNI